MPPTQPGDAAGRRPARQRAARLAEAGRVIQALKFLLDRASFGTMEASSLAGAVTREELRQLQIAHGKIEPRKRFKRLSSQPLLDHRLIHNLYLDESGKSAAEPPSEPPFFTLGAIAMAEEDVDSYRAAADRIKRDFFRRTDITFHEPDMRLHDGPYQFSGDKTKQHDFDSAMEQLLLGAKFLAFGVGIRKRAFVEEFVETGIDPYLPTDAYAVAITMLLERYMDFLAMTCPEYRLGRLTLESIGSREDAEHQLQYARLLLEGSQWIPDAVFRNYLETGLRFVPKQGSHPCELADMFSRELYEWIRGDCDVTPLRWELFSKKIYCRGDGQMGKFGVKVFPDSDIRDQIEAHRTRCGAELEN